MRHEAQSGFMISNANVRNDILIPRYYDPRIAQDISELTKTCDLVTIQKLVENDCLEHRHGSYVPKIHYGTGAYPYIRTSDLANCEIKASPKHGVSHDVFIKFHAEQDVRRGDILFVHEGTYLIGSSALVTKYDGEILYQHHLAKFRVNSCAPFDAFYFLACINSEIVRRQIRSKQFTADVIDSVVGRVGEVVIPIHKDTNRIKAVGAVVKKSIEGRAKAREALSYSFTYYESYLSGLSAKDVDHIREWEPEVFGANNDYTRFLGGRHGFKSYLKKNSGIVDNILIPKYYDPAISKRLQYFAGQCDLHSVGQLIDRGFLSLEAGDEIGKISYGTGQISFVRTSDLGTYELLQDTKHNISDDICDTYSAKQNVQAGDIFIVRDGTYLVGSSVIVSESDLPLLYCAGINKIRVKNGCTLDPYLIFALLNMPVVKDQIKSKQFTRDVIDTIGHRLKEVVLPIPKDATIRGKISSVTKWLYESRIQQRIDLSDAFVGLYG